MEPYVILIAIVIGLPAIIVMAWWASSYNRIVELRNRVTEAANTVEVQELQRHDLMPDVVGAAREYTRHEAESLDKVLASRERRGSGAAASVGGSPLGGVNVEAYPSLRAVEAYTSGQGIQRDTEKDIAAARRFLADSLQRYNSAIQSFPTSLVARTHNFKPMSMPSLPEEVRAKPELWS